MRASAACLRRQVFSLDTNIQRFFYHSDDVTAMAVLIRTHQAPDGTWMETNEPRNFRAREEWSKWFAYSAGIHKPNPTAWTPRDRTLPVHTDEFPCMRDGAIYDWRTWDLPNRCVVASGQRGRNPRIYVWRILPPRGEHSFEGQLLAKMSLGTRRREVGLLSFNSDGTYLIALSQDFEHHLTVFDWRKQTKIREGEGGGEGVECLRFNPYSGSAFASCGVKHLKFWELGDTDLECAVGLVGDIGEPLNQYVMAFHPRGITLSGNDNGEIYAWSNGVVSAKYERAHKSKVLGLLYVEGLALFSAGMGGEPKMWDPELRDTSTPIGCVDLKSFQPKGSPALLQKLSGRSMDWSTDPDLMRDIEDSNPVKDDPRTRRVRRACDPPVVCRPRVQGCAVGGHHLQRHPRPRHQRGCRLGPRRLAAHAPTERRLEKFRGGPSRRTVLVGHQRCQQLQGQVWGQAGAPAGGRLPLPGQRRQRPGIQAAQPSGPNGRVPLEARRVRQVCSWQQPLWDGRHGDSDAQRAHLRVSIV